MFSIMDEKNILEKIKKSIAENDADAVVYLYGSYARKTHKNDSDIDILILSKNKKIDSTYEQKITYPLYDIEFETGKIISPMVYSFFEWENKYKNTPFYLNVMNEGIKL